MSKRIARVMLVAAVAAPTLLAGVGASMRRLWFVGAAVALVAFTAVATSQAHVPGFTLNGTGTAMIDGVIQPQEWDSAGTLTFQANVLEGGTAPATLYEMNDAGNLYLGVRVQRPSLGPSGVVFEFDNDHSGSFFAEGDDALVANAQFGFFDDYRTAKPPCPPGHGCGLVDTAGGGTIDGSAAASNDGTYSYYELAHPLDDADDAHDFSLHAGDTVGWIMQLRFCNSSRCVDTELPERLAASAPGGDFLIQAADTTPPVLSVSADPGLLWPPNHQLVPVSLATEATDDSGHVTVALVSVESSEPDSGRSQGDRPNDIQEAELGTADTSVLLRAERLGEGPGRTYTLTYRATDPAGNTTSVSVEVPVPHDLR